MKPARLIVLFIAVAAGGVAAMLAGGSDPPPPQAPAPVAKLDTVDVLVAKGDIGMGQKVTPAEMEWRNWPKDAAGPTFIRKSDMPDALEKLTGAIARNSFVAGEPIREAKLVKAEGSGFMAAILPSGMRAISTEITPETGAGGFILPNDRVDVILSRREKDDKGDRFVSETILSNVRVLAIDQTIAEKDGQKVVIGKTATLELGLRQAETLAVSRQKGTLSLALRSLVDSNRSAPETVGDDENSRGVNTVRFGVSSTTAIK
jgi:pilus assembly protein CpaB